MNTSILNDDKTARTNPESALQRAENLWILGSKKVLELCCGPSLKVLSKSYKRFGIKCWGNDIEERWINYYPEGKWILGDCLTLNVNDFDTLVFAPPVTKGCTGKRVDSLELEKVNPSYYDFINTYKNFKGTIVLVLPSRSIATNYDRKQYYKFINYLSKLYKVDVVPLTEGKRKIRKYVDVYLTKL